MNYLTHLIYAYPRDAKYTPVPADQEIYDGGGIEDYGCEIREFPTTVGDVYTARYHYWEDDQCKLAPRQWKVASVHSYSPVEDEGFRFAVAVLTFDGKPIPVDDELEDDDCNIVQLVLMPENIKISWPAARKHTYKVGDAVWKADYEVERISVFHPDPGFNYHEARVIWTSAKRLAATSLAIA